MANLTAEFYMALEKELKDKKIESAAPKLYKNGSHLYPDEIYKYMGSKDMYVATYARALMVYNLILIPVVKPEFVDYILEAEKFIDNTNVKQLHKAFYFHLDQALSTIIRKFITKFNKTTKKLAALATKIKKYDGTFTHSFFAMQLKFSLLISEMQTNLFSDINERVITAVFNNIKFFEEQEYNVSSVKELCISPIITFIQLRNGIIANCTKYQQNVEADRKFLSIIVEFLDKDDKAKRDAESDEAKAERINRNSCFRQDIKIIYQKLDFPEPEQEEKKPIKQLRAVKAKTRRIPVYMQTKIITLNINNASDIVTDDTREAKETDTWTSSFYKGKYADNEISMKVYNLKNDAKLDQIYKEIKCYQILSQNIASNSCFMKYYGSILEEDRIILVMEPLNETLAAKLNRLKETDQKLNQGQEATWMANLIKSFEIMEELNIYHGDFSIYNILVDHENKLKIINFQLPEKDDEQEQSLREKPVQKDIYGLGVVFLQLLTLENIPDYSNDEGKKALLAMVEEKIKDEEKKKLLKSMLCEIPQERPKLITINQLMEPITTKTVLSSRQVK